MNNFRIPGPLLLLTAAIFFIAGCKKDITGDVAGKYTGIAEVYSMGPAGSHDYPGTVINIIKLNKTTINFVLVSSVPDFDLNGPIAIRKNGTFGDGLHTPPGTFYTFGSEGRFRDDSLFCSFATVDSAGFNTFLSFQGRRD